VVFLCLPFIIIMLRLYVLMLLHSRSFTHVYLEPVFTFGKILLLNNLFLPDTEKRGYLKDFNISSYDTLLLLTVQDRQ